MCSPEWIYGELLNLKFQEEEKKASAGAVTVLVPKRTEPRRAPARTARDRGVAAAKWVLAILRPDKIGDPAQAEIWRS
jgi:hypothetical protein